MLPVRGPGLRPERLRDRRHPRDRAEDQHPRLPVRDEEDAGQGHHAHPPDLLRCRLHPRHRGAVLGMGSILPDSGLV